MRFLQRFMVMVTLLLLVSVGAYAQAVTGGLTGTVTTDGNGLPGATVTITSPNLQGTRTAVTDINGNYNFVGLPPGDYTVKVELSGMQTVTRTTRVALASTARVDADLKLSAVAEAITVTAGAEPVMESAQVATNLPATIIEELPIARTVLATATLAPGVNTNTLSGSQLQISGSPGYDNLITVNGVSLQENIRGQALDLFIEDAIQETTVLTGAVSAEYGRFTGGVVNSITKSGGNEFSGSIRDSLTNAKWAAERPGETITTDKINPVYEATLGGYIMRDRLWFFVAGRDQKLDSDLQTSRTNIPYTQSRKETRYEYKLTGAITPKHNLVGSYLDYKRTINNTGFTPFYDTASISPARKDPMKLIAGHYNGIITSNFLVEAHYAQRDWDVAVGSGGLKTTDLATGSWGYDLSTGRFFNAPVFCGNCDTETRNSDSYTLKGTYYLATKATGTHNLVGGYDNFSEHRHANNFQSGSDWELYVGGVVMQANGSTPVLSPNGFVYPVIRPGRSIFNWAPIFDPSTSDSNLNTKSFFVNDRWDFSNKFTFNIGARYDQAHAADANGNVSSDDKTISPRLTAIYDVLGNGRHRITGAYNRYVSKVGEGPGTATESAGQPASVYFIYGGPAINYVSGKPTANLDSRAAFAQAFGWLQAQGGQNATDLIIGGFIPGYDTRFTKSLNAPYVDEMIVGYGTQLGNNFYAKADYIKRDWKEFYAYFLDQTAPQQTDFLGLVHDVATVGNTNDIERKYNGLQFQLGWRPSRFNVGLNYTYSTLKGNDQQESAGSGTVGNRSGFQYCEIVCYPELNPTGYLAGDQKHRARGWVAYDIPTPSWFGGLNVSLLENYDSGVAYSAVGLVDPWEYASRDAGCTSNCLEDFGYAYNQLSPNGYNYFFGKRGQYRTPNITSTDMSLNYTRGLFKGLDLFAQGELINVFNEQGVVAVNQTVLTSFNSSSMETFDPRTQTPVEGVNWAKGASFGKPTGPTSYQTARTYRFSLGLRF